MVFEEERYIHSFLDMLNDRKTYQIMNVKTFNDLVAGIRDGQKKIIITRSILCNYPILLPEGVNLTGQAQENGELPLLSFNIRTELV